MKSFDSAGIPGNPNPKTVVLNYQLRLAKGQNDYNRSGLAKHSLGDHERALVDLRNRLSASIEQSKEPRNSTREDEETSEEKKKDSDQ